MKGSEFVFDFVDGMFFKFLQQNSTAVDHT